MKIENLEYIVNRTVEGLQKFKKNPLNEERSKELISDLSNLQAFLISLHIMKIAVVPPELGKKAIREFNKFHLSVLEYYLRELYKLEEPRQENDTNIGDKPYISSIASVKVCTECLSEDMQNHKTNKLLSISKNTLDELMGELQGIKFSKEELEHFASSFAGSFISSLLYSFVKNNELQSARDLLYSIVYRTFQTVNVFAERKIFDSKIEFEEKKLGDT